MILLEPAHKILHTTVKFKRRTISVTPFSGTSPSHFTLWSRQLALRLRVDLQSPRKVVPKGRPLEVLQSAENRRSNFICGAVPEGVGSETGRAYIASFSMALAALAVEFIFGHWNYTTVLNIFF